MPTAVSHDLMSVPLFSYFTVSIEIPLVLLTAVSHAVLSELLFSYRAVNSPGDANCCQSY